MMKENLRAIILLIAFGLVGVGYFGVGYVHDKAYSEGYSRGHEVGQKEVSVKDAKNYQSLVNTYNGLVASYNQLRDNPTNKYIPAYQPKTPLSCTTYNYSAINSTTTNCY